MHIPAIGHAVARSYMPQIDDAEDFISYLKTKGITTTLQSLNPDNLKSTQQDFDANKVFSMMSDKGEKKPIITSNDNHILDGHHRWLEAANKKEAVNAHVADCPILDLLHHAKRYTHQEIGLVKEEIERKHFGPMLDSFVSFASEKLGIKSLPNIRYKDDNDDYNSFAAYHPDHKEISIAVGNRHPMDVFRSLAHELVHHSQNEYGRLYDGAGETGSPIEDEANYMAGRIMRLYAKSKPDTFQCRHIAEAVFVVGGPCSGKDRMARQLSEKYGFQETDVGLIEQEYPWDRDLIINASADQIDLINEAQILLEQGQGYTTKVLFVDTTNEISKLRNEARAAKGQRVLSEGVRFEKYTQAQKNKKKLMEMFGSDFHVIDNSIQESKNDVTVKVKVEQPKPAAKKKSSSSSSSKKSAVKKKPKKSPEQIKMEMEAQKQRFNEKNEKAKQAFAKDSEDRKLAHERETQAREIHSQAHQQRALEFQAKIETIRSAMMRLQPVGKNYKAIHGQLRKQMGAALLGMRKYQKQSASLYQIDNKVPKPVNTPDAKAMNEQFASLFEEGGAGEWGTPELRAKYQKDTPGQPVVDFKEVDNATTDITVIAGPASNGDYPGETQGNYKAGMPGLGNLGAYSGLSEQVKSWAMNEKTIERFKSRYESNWEAKILETAMFLEAQQIQNNKPRSLRVVQEALKCPGNDTFLNNKSKKIIKRKQ